MPRVLFPPTLFLMLLLLPLAPARAKTLASEAIETALENGTFQQVQQDLMMDLHQKQRYEFDEAGVETLGRRLLAEYQMDTAIEVLQLNQVLHSESPQAAVAVADAYRESGQSMVAQVYYDKALSLDPGNHEARRGMQEIDGEDAGSKIGTGDDWELGPEAMQESLAQMGELRFEDAMGGTWGFEVGDNGKVDGVNYTSRDGTSTEMKRLGDPRSFE